METIGYGLSLEEYENGQTVPTLTLGDGSVGVLCLRDDVAKVAGVGFSPKFGEPQEVGKEIEEVEDYSSYNIAFQVLFSNPKSIDVVINNLQIAKQILENSNEDA